MNILYNIEWYLDEPKNAIIKNTNRKIKKKELDTIVFDHTTTENVKFYLPLQDQFSSILVREFDGSSFTLIRELPRPITVKQILQLIHQFYQEPLKEEYIHQAFTGNELWKKQILQHYNGDITQLKNYDIFTQIRTPDFSGIYLMYNMDNIHEYFVGIGPE